MFSCNTLSAYTQTCGSLIAGGVEKVYAIATKDLSGSTTVSAEGLISNIVPLTGKTFVEVEIVPETVNFEQDVQANIANGTGSFNVNMNLIINNYNNDSRKFIDSVLAQPVAFLVKMRSGKYTYISNARMQSTKIVSGVAGGDRNGAEIAFVSVESEILREVDATLIANIIA